MHIELQGFFAMIYETHTHFDDKAFDADRDDAIKAAMAAGVARFVNVASSMESSRTSLDLAHTYPEFLAAVGVHPEECADLTEADMELLRTYTEDENVVAIGEIGLDYYWDEPARDIQKKWFVRQIALAGCVRLPLIIHSRDAAEDTYDILRAEKADEIGGIMHCFSYSKEMAAKFLDMGFYIGVGGVITFKNGRKLREVVEYVPLEKIVVETDSPYMAPHPNRGKRNTSEYLPYVVEEIAKVKGISKEEVEEITYNNAKRLFGK